MKHILGFMLLLVVSGCMGRKLPACDSVEVAQLARQAIDESPLMKLLKESDPAFSIKSFGMLSEVKYNEEPPKRTCAVVVETQAQERLFLLSSGRARTTSGLNMWKNREG